MPVLTRTRNRHIMSSSWRTFNLFCRCREWMRPPCSNPGLGFLICQVINMPWSAMPLHSLKIQMCHLRVCRQPIASGQDALRYTIYSFNCGIQLSCGAVEPWIHWRPGAVPGRKASRVQLVAFEHGIQDRGKEHLGLRSRTLFAFDADIYTQQNHYHKNYIYAIAICYPCNKRSPYDAGNVHINSLSFQSVDSQMSLTVLADSSGK